MKLSRVMAALLSVLSLLCVLLPTAYAEESTAAKYDDSYFEDKSWDDIVYALLEECEASELQVGIGYYNTVTGEEHYINGENYMVAASMFKVPLNMYFTEKISAGEMSMDTPICNGIPYSSYLESTIIHSSNTDAKTLWDYIGSYRKYREEIARFMGEDKDNVDPMYYVNNYFTPRQEICCLKTLAAEPERFPGVIEAMQRAEPSKYFRRDEKGYDIAHKYGYVLEDSDHCLYINDSAIAYTDEPICLVMFTRAVKKPYTLLAEYCTLMCAYAQYHTRIDREAAEAEAAAARAAAEAELKAAMEAELLKKQENLAEAPARVPKAVTTTGENMNNLSLDKLNMSSLLLILVLAIVAVIALILLISLKVRKKIKFLWGLLALVFAVAGVLAAIVGANLGTVISRADGDPRQTVDSFFIAVLNGNYTAAYDCLDDYADLGLSSEPSDPVGKRIVSALRESYDYKLIGDCTVDGLSAVQQVEFRYFDLTGIGEKLAADANEYIEQLVRERNRSELYDDNDRYLESVTDEVYEHAVAAVLSHAEDYYRTVVLELELNYTDGAWRLHTSQPMLTALTGGTAA